MFDAEAEAGGSGFGLRLGGDDCGVGAVFGGRSLDIERRLPVPVLDGVRCAAPMIEALISIRAPGASTEGGRNHSDRLVAP